jgi:predicted RND superfamily exporter protein
MAMQWKNMRFSNTEANLLPDNHPVNLAYKDFVSRFGEEGNIIAIAIKDSALFELNNFKKWNRLSKAIGSIPRGYCRTFHRQLKAIRAIGNRGEVCFFSF